MEENCDRELRESANPYSAPKMSTVQGGMASFLPVASVSAVAIGIPGVFEAFYGGKFAEHWGPGVLVFPFVCGLAPSFIGRNRHTSNSIFHGLTWQIGAAVGTAVAILVCLYFAVRLSRPMIEDAFGVDSWIEAPSRLVVAGVFAVSYSAIRTLSLVWSRFGLLRFFVAHLLGSLLIAVPFFVFMDDLKLWSRIWGTTFFCLLFGSFSYADTLARLFRQTKAEFD